MTSQPSKIKPVPDSAYFLSDRSGATARSGKCGLYARDNLRGGNVFLCSLNMTQNGIPARARSTICTPWRLPLLRSSGRSRVRLAIRPISTIVRSSATKRRGPGLTSAERLYATGPQNQGNSYGFADSRNPWYLFTGQVPYVRLTDRRHRREHHRFSPCLS